MEELGEMTEAVKLFGEFGVLAMLLVLVLTSVGMALRWFGTHAILPIVRAAIEYMSQQTETAQNTLTSLEDLRRLETDIRAAIIEMRETHSDADSTFATVHTNHALKILARAVARIADGMDGINIDDLVQEIRDVLSRQDKSQR